MKLATCLLAFVSLCSPSVGQTICYETFAYSPGALDFQDGGIGWAEPWNAFGSVVISSSMDNLGGAARVNPSNGFATCWRRPDTSAWGHLLDNGRLGRDGSSLFLRFRIRRSQGSQSEYGGLTLYNDQQPALFIGAPWMVSRWCLEDHTTGLVHHAVNSSIATQALLVVRLDFAPGPERARLWVNTSVFPPVGAPAVDVQIADMRFNRFRLAAGISTPGSYDFDEIILRDALGPILGWSYCSNAVPNSTGQPGTIGALGSDLRNDNQISLWAAGMPTNQFGFFMGSRAQGLLVGPGGSQGNLCLSGQIARFNGPGQVRPTGNNGRFSLPLDLSAFPNPGGGFQSVQVGESWHFQAWYRDSIPGQGAVSNFTSGLTVMFQ